LRGFDRQSVGDSQKTARFLAFLQDFNQFFSVFS